MTNTNTEANAALRCNVCKLGESHVAHIEHHPTLGFACWTCRDTHDTGNKILVILARATRNQANQRTIASKLSRSALSINSALAQLSRFGLIERAYSNPNLERPSAATYKLTAAGIAGTKDL